MLDIHGNLASLAKQRPVFYSEADFQHAFAWQSQSLPDSNIRLELPVKGESRRYLDISVSYGKERVLLELKYKTRSLMVNFSDEKFALRDQGAQDIGRYDYLKDIERLETMLEGQDAARGYAILLSNDHGYWTTTRSHTVDAAFRLHENSLSGVRHWDANASAGTRRGREAPIRLRGKYQPLFAMEGVGGQFRYLLHEVRSG